MNFTDIDFITDMMSTRKMGYFKVLAKDGKTIINEVDLDEFKSDKDSINELTRTIAAQETGEIVFVKICSRSKKEKADGGIVRNYEYRVRCNDDSGGKRSHKNDNSSQVTAINGDILRLMEEKKALELKLQEKEHEKALDIIRAEIKDLKESSPIDKYLPAIMGFFTQGQPQQAAVAGINGINETEETPVIDNKKVITNALNRLLKIDRNLPETLTSLANFAEKDPTKYLSFLPILKSM